MKLCKEKIKPQKQSSTTFPSQETFSTSLKEASWFMVEIFQFIAKLLSHKGMFRYARALNDGFILKCSLSPTKGTFVPITASCMTQEMDTCYILPNTAIHATLSSSPSSLSFNTYWSLAYSGDLSNIHRSSTVSYEPLSGNLYKSRRLFRQNGEDKLAILSVLPSTISECSQSSIWGSYIHWVNFTCWWVNQILLQCGHLTYIAKRPHSFHLHTFVISLTYWLVYLIVCWDGGQLRRARGDHTRRRQLLLCTHKRGIKIWYGFVHKWSSESITNWLYV